jgi:hypothetical protein
LFAISQLFEQANVAHSFEERGESGNVAVGLYPVTMPVFNGDHPRAENALIDLYLISASMHEFSRCHPYCILDAHM